ncbi:TonB-dependent receptor [Massilia soli]|uniref:TonB-dependent receptor n=1 Tax=Massilia soli TaxID=2792854 RepID=A0ABS7SVG2_9BURK|nr:TonB-dependent receptor [Massilia soli]MBZ2209946.1 TonB-dependent receptor [Massilia soli]
MKFQRTLAAAAVLSAISSLSHAQTMPQGEQAAIPKVVVTATPFRAAEGDQILTPAKILAGDELRDKVGSSLGETLSQELGVSASGFGPGASRPIIRGLEGSRVKMLENGMAVSDVSGLSNDHAVAAEGATARQIEILRGPASLLYGSGAIGGLVNVVNERIPTHLEEKLAGQAELRYGTVDDSRNASGSVDGSAGAIGFHVDGNVRRAHDYTIPGPAALGEDAPPRRRLGNSFTRQETGGAGASLVGAWGHVGASVSLLDSLYGIPSGEGARIDQSQTRYDIDSMVKSPFSGMESVKFKLGFTDYEHTELDADSDPEVKFTNRSLESRLELTHKPVSGWHGTFGVQTENSHFAAIGADGGHEEHEDGAAEEEHGSHVTVPATHSTSVAGFLVEEREFGKLRMSAGLRLESVKRRPDGLLKRDFNLTSYSVGGMYPVAPGYSAGLTLSVAQRAPATEELYSEGPHHATETFDIGNPNLKKETSHNIELTVQKTTGLVRWKANLFENKVNDFVYGRVTGVLVEEDGEALRERLFEQADARIRGAEAEIGYNQLGQGLSMRAFADTSRGKLERGGSLPLQPAKRVGFDIGYKKGTIRTGLSVMRAMEQDRLASFEATATPAYTQVGANLSYTQKYRNHDLTWFLLAKNLLDDDIRLSTSLLKDLSPLPGRNFVFGVRTRF